MTTSLSEIDGECIICKIRGADTQLTCCKINRFCPECLSEQWTNYDRICANCRFNHDTDSYGAVDDAGESDTSSETSEELLLEEHRVRRLNSIYNEVYAEIMIKVMRPHSSNAVFMNQRGNVVSNTKANWDRSQLERIGHEYRHRVGKWLSEGPTPYDLQTDREWIELVGEVEEENTRMRAEGRV